MTLSGVFRDGHPRITLNLPGREEDFEVEFLVDTGFDGDLALPAHLAHDLQARIGGYRVRQQADGAIIQCPCYHFFFEWDDEDEPQFVEVLVTGSAPLLGTTFLAERLLQIEITEGGEVNADPL